MFPEEVSHGWESTPTKRFNGNITFGEPTCVNISVEEKGPGFSASHIAHHKALLGGLADEGAVSRLVEGRGGQRLELAGLNLEEMGLLSMSRRGRELRSLGWQLSLNTHTVLSKGGTDNRPWSNECWGAQNSSSLCDLG